MIFYMRTLCLSLLLWPFIIFGESRDEAIIRKYSKGNDNLRDSVTYKEEINFLYTKSETLGYYEFESKPTSSNIITQTIVDSFSKPINYDNVLILRIYCNVNDSFLSINYRNKEAFWSIDKSNLKGQSHTDGIGFLKIRFSSKGSVRDQKMKINLQDVTKQIDLQSGPYELFLPESSCKN